MADINDAVKRYVDALQKRITNYYTTNYKNLVPSVVTVKRGQKFYKIITTYDGGKGQSSVHSFVDKNTGDIFKPASWNARAKHTRGNVFSPELGMEAIDGSYHVRYLK